ncbi:MAG TPA: hypothetical protein VG166_09200 [Caulobacteraceae bacterium]|jgi:hypothetical protein|nr:hypothetical protein [Caulobacteraceae bacterium]
MTTGSLLPAPVLVALDGNGDPISGALLQFFATGTTTPATTYSDAGLTTPNANPVVANGSGMFGPVYLDPTVTYRVQLKTAGGSVIADIDPVLVGAAEATTTQTNAGTAHGVYVSPYDLAAWTGVATALGYTPVNKAGDTATNLAITPTAPATNSAGYLGTPINNQTASYALVLSDTGKMVRMSNASANTATIPPNSSVAYPLGTAIVIRNIGAGTCTVTRGSGVTLRIVGSTTSKDVAMTQWGLATLVKEDADTWLISGTNIS